LFYGGHSAVIARRGSNPEACQTLGRCGHTRHGVRHARWCQTHSARCQTLGGCLSAGVRSARCQTRSGVRHSARCQTRQVSARHGVRHARQVSARHGVRHARQVSDTLGGVRHARHGVAAVLRYYLNLPRQTESSRGRPGYSLTTVTVMLLLPLRAACQTAS
jgi:hypothetical protein